MSKKLKKVKLLLCCNRHPRKGWVNVDLVAFPGVDVVADLDDPWPWEDSSIDEILAVDAIEHFKDRVHTFNEVWRVLKPNAIFHHLTPSDDSRGFGQDPDHKSAYNANSWNYYAVHKEDNKWVSHPWRAQYSPHWIKGAFELVYQHTSALDGANISYEEVRMAAIKEPIWTPDKTKLEKDVVWEPQQPIATGIGKTLIITKAGMQGIAKITIP